MSSGETGARARDSGNNGEIGAAVLSAFALKVIAMATMLCDHMGIAFFGNDLGMRNVGRLAFIIYAFLMAEAYYHLENRPDRIRYHLGKLFLLFAAAEIPYDLFDHGKWDDPSTQNVIATLLLGFLALVLAGQWRRHCAGKAVREEAQTKREDAQAKRVDSQAALLMHGGALLIYIAAAFVSYYIRSEYKFAGVLLVIFFYH